MIPLRVEVEEVGDVDIVLAERIVRARRRAAIDAGFIRIDLKRRVNLCSCLAGKSGFQTMLWWSAF